MNEGASGGRSERQRFCVGYPFRLGFGVSLGLFLDRGQADAPVVRFRLDNAVSLPVSEQDVVGRSDVHLVLTDGRAEPSVEIERILVRTMPPGRPQTFVDLITSDLLGG